MRKLTPGLGVLLAVLATAGLAAGSTRAQGLELGEAAAAIALPLITGGHPSNPIKGTRGDILIGAGQAVTLNSVTNARSAPVLLEVDVISGDPSDPLLGGDTWQSDSFECLVKAHETVTFVHVPDVAGIDSITIVECSTPLATSGVFADQRTVATRAANGILWLAAADPATGQTISQDVLFGVSVVVDVALGQAFSFGGISFQSGQGFNDGDKIYRFDDTEYARWPSVVATNYIAPDAPVELRIQAELILFTLDGTTGNPTPPRVALGGLAYDDDENYFDFQHEFDCFDVVALTDISPNFSQAFNGGSLSGHLQLVAQPIATVNDVHDAAYGDANNSRRRPVHGWIVQSVLAGQALVQGGQPTVMQGAAFGPIGGAAWGRPLSQGLGALLPFGNDQDPAFDADPLF